jgi:hypothetical protein
MKQLVFVLLFLTVVDNAFSQGDFYDQGGKINSVVVVVFILITGIGLILFWLDRRISKIEKNIEDDYSK